MTPETIVAAVLFTAWASTVAGVYQMLRSEDESQSPVRTALRITKSSRLTAERDAKSNSLSSAASEVERHTREFRGDEREGRPSTEDSLAPLKRRAAKLRKALERAQEAEFEVLSENREKTPAEESRLRALRKRTVKLEAELQDLTDRINRGSASIIKDALKRSNSKLSTDLYDKVERRIRAKEVAANALYRSKGNGLLGVREEWTANLELSRRMAILAARASVLTKARKEALRREQERIVADRVKRIRNSVADPVVAAIEYLERVLLSLDLNVERSYNRAFKHLSKAQNALDNAIEVADLIPDKLFSDANTMYGSSQSPEMSDSQKEAAIKLDVQLKIQQADHDRFVRDMRLRIVFAEDRVLMAEFACCRLFVLKVLIDLIPKKFEDRTINSSFVQIANSIRGLVKSEKQLEDELKLSLFDKMANLELRILTLYVRIAKGETAPLTATETATLSARLAEVEPVLIGLKAVREQNSDMWRSRGENAAAEGLEISPAIMSSRGQNDEMLAKFIERSLDALKVLVAIHSRA